MSESRKHRGTSSAGAAAYTAAGAFIGGTGGGGGWLGLVLLSLAGLYGGAALRVDLIAAAVAVAVILALAFLCARLSLRAPFSARASQEDVAIYQECG